MKKGCFVKSIILLTVLTAVLLYLINYKFNDILINPGKKFIINQVTEEMSFVKSSPEKDSLKALIRNYVNRVKTLNNISSRQIGNFADSLKMALKDSIITKSEYGNLYRMLNRKVN